MVTEVQNQILKVRNPDISSKVLVLLGPTASGKTQLSLSIATALDGEIISADSRQVYKFLDIGTAKPTVDERKRVKHYFIDELLPDQEFNAGEFGKKGRLIIDDIIKRNKIPIVVGGSGLYIKALVDGLFEGPTSDKTIRHHLFHRLKIEGSEKLLEELRSVDPTAAEKMLPSNTRRIIRALEVYQLTGTPISELQKSRIPINFSAVFVGLNWERKQLYERINKRVDCMLKEGLIEEVKDLISKGYSQELNSLQTVGYKEVFDFIQGKIDYQQMVTLIKRNTRRFAKRQLTWFRHDARITWFDVSNESEFEKVGGKICDYFLSSGRADSNRRPLGPEPSALAGLSHAP